MPAERLEDADAARRDMKGGAAAEGRKRGKGDGRSRSRKGAAAPAAAVRAASVDQARCTLCVSLAGVCPLQYMT